MEAKDAARPVPLRPFEAEQEYCPPSFMLQNCRTDCANQRSPNPTVVDCTVTFAEALQLLSVMSSQEGSGPDQVIAGRGLP